MEGEVKHLKSQLKKKKRSGGDHPRKAACREVDNNPELPTNNGAPDDNTAVEKDQEQGISSSEMPDTGQNTNNSIVQEEGLLSDKLIQDAIPDTPRCEQSDSQINEYKDSVCETRESQDVVAEEHTTVAAIDTENDSTSLLTDEEAQHAKANVAESNDCNTSCAKLSETTQLNTSRENEEQDTASDKISVTEYSVKTDVNDRLSIDTNKEDSSHLESGTDDNLDNRTSIDTESVAQKSSSLQSESNCNANTSSLKTLPLRPPPIPIFLNSSLSAMKNLPAMGSTSESSVSLPPFSISSISLPTVTISLPTFTTAPNSLQSSSAPALILPTSSISVISPVSISLPSSSTSNSLPLVTVSSNELSEVCVSSVPLPPATVMAHVPSSVSINEVPLPTTSVAGSIHQTATSCNVDESAKEGNVKASEPSETSSNSDTNMTIIVPTSCNANDESLSSESVLNQNGINNSSNKSAASPPYCNGEKRERTASESSSDDSISVLEPPPKVAKVIETVTIDDTKDESEDETAPSKKKGSQKKAFVAVKEKKPSVPIDEVLKLKKLELLRVHEREEAKRVAKEQARREEYEAKERAKREEYEAKERARREEYEAREQAKREEYEEQLRKKNKRSTSREKRSRIGKQENIQLTTSSKLHKKRKENVLPNYSKSKSAKKRSHSKSDEDNSYHKRKRSSKSVEKDTYKIQKTKHKKLSKRRDSDKRKSTLKNKRTKSHRKKAKKNKSSSKKSKKKYESSDSSDDSEKLKRRKKKSSKSISDKNISATVGSPISDDQTTTAVERDGGEAIASHIIDEVPADGGEETPQQEIGLNPGNKLDTERNTPQTHDSSSDSSSSESNDENDDGSINPSVVSGGGNSNDTDNDDQQSFGDDKSAASDDNEEDELKCGNASEQECSPAGGSDQDSIRSSLVQQINLRSSVQENPICDDAKQDNSNCTSNAHSSLNLKENIVDKEAKPGSHGENTNKDDSQLEQNASAIDDEVKPDRKESEESTEQNISAPATEHNSDRFTYMPEYQLYYDHSSGYYYDSVSLLK